jgi:hypothetical protein
VGKDGDKLLVLFDTLTLTHPPSSDEHMNYQVIVPVKQSGQNVVPMTRNTQIRAISEGLE